MNASKGNDVMGNLRTVILAAGKGTRMKSDVPKVLHEACGKPIVEYVLDAAKAAGSLKTYVVVGYKGDAVKKQVGSGPIIVRQPKLSGTADAVRRVAGYLKNYRGDVLILCGDTPLLNKTAIKELVGKHKNSKAICTFLTAAVGDPQGYGRIIRDERGKVVAIREDKDAFDHEQI